MTTVDLKPDNLIKTRLPKIVFFGSGDLSAQILDYCLTNIPEIQIVAVITSPAPSGGHKRQQTSPVTELATRYQIPVLRPTQVADCIPDIVELKPDAGLLMAYGKMLPTALLDCFPKKIVNVHPSLLPRHRGPSPIEATILNGDTFAGSSLMLISPDMDAGPIIAQSSFSISQTIFKTTLTDQLISVSQELLNDHLMKWLQAESTEMPQKQPKWRNVSYCSLISKEDGRINLGQDSAVTLDRKIRAFAGWPGCRLMVNYRQTILDLILLEAQLIDELPQDKPSVYFQENKLIAQTCFGKIELIKVQLPGKSPISGQDLANAGTISLD